MTTKVDSNYTPNKNWTVNELHNMISNNTKKIDLTKLTDIDGFIPHLHEFQEVMANMESLPSRFSLPSIQMRSEKTFIFSCNDSDVNTSEVAMNNIYCLLSVAKDNKINRVKRNMKLNNCHVTLIDLLPEDIYTTINDMVQSQLAIFFGKELINICIDCDDLILRKDTHPSIQNKDEAIEAVLKFKAAQI